MIGPLVLYLRQMVAHDHKTLRVVLPGYRSGYAANDFSDLDTRKVDIAVAKYLNQRSRPLFTRKPREIVFEVPTTHRESQREETTKRAFQDLFLELANSNWQKCSRQIPRTILLVLIGLFILLISHQVGQANLDRPVRSTLSDAVQVGGWVAMWTAFAAVFFELSEALLNYFAFRRLSRLPMKFEYCRCRPAVDSASIKAPVP